MRWNAARNVCKPAYYVVRTQRYGRYSRVSVGYQDDRNPRGTGRSHIRARVTDHHRVFRAGFKLFNAAQTGAGGVAFLAGVESPPMTLPKKPLMSRAFRICGSPRWVCWCTGPAGSRRDKNTPALRGHAGFRAVLCGRAGGVYFHEPGKQVLDGRFSAGLRLPEPRLDQLGDPGADHRPDVSTVCVCLTLLIEQGIQRSRQIRAESTRVPSRSQTMAADTRVSCFQAATLSAFLHPG